MNLSDEEQDEVARICTKISSALAGEKAGVAVLALAYVTADTIKRAFPHSYQADVIRDTEGILRDVNREIIH